MMLPGMTISPPNFLTPSRRPALSRPLREEPPAFLCAILNLLLRRLRRRLRRHFGRPPAPSSAAGARRALSVDLIDPQHGLELAVAVLAAGNFSRPFFVSGDPFWSGRLRHARAGP